MNGASGAAYSLVGRHFIKTWPYHLRQKALDEIYWYKAHSGKFSFFPQYHASSQENDNLSLSIERLVDHTSLLDRFSTYPACCSDINTLYCHAIDKIFDEMHSFKINVVLSQREWLTYLFKQTSNRIMSHCGKNPLINKLIYDSVVINDNSYLSVISCLQHIENILSGHFTLLASPQKAILCHGDPHAGNIMIPAHGFLLSMMKEKSFTMFFLSTQTLFPGSSGLFTMVSTGICSKKITIII
jgi:hypothetical protein